MTEEKALQPLSNGGNVLIVGAKASNFDEEIRTHPRVIMWDSQNQHWSDKDIPQNVRAIFMTRFISHATSTKLLTEARKKQLTIFNPDGTGRIVRQVKELLAIPATPVVRLPVKPMVQSPTSTYKGKSKFDQLYQYIDWNKKIIENARVLYAKAQELGIQTTLMSTNERIRSYGRSLGHPPTRTWKKQGIRTVRVKKESVKTTEVDVSVQILDGMIKGLTDMREFLLATVAENQALRQKLNRFKELIGE